MSSKPHKVLLNVIRHKATNPQTFKTLGEKLISFYTPNFSLRSEMKAVKG